MTVQIKYNSTNAARVGDHLNLLFVSFDNYKWNF